MVAYHSCSHVLRIGHGQSNLPDDIENVNLHFISLTVVDGVLYELDGRKSRPIAHGPSQASTLLADAIAVVKEFMARDPDNLRFSMVALIANQ